MSFAIGLVVLIIVLALIMTIALTGKSDEDYQKKTKNNTFRLTSIYIIFIIIAIIGLSWYISTF
jgi:heme/copper-type cytochrome/quinol oxidase subunit 2